MTALLDKRKKENIFTFYEKLSYQVTQTKHHINMFVLTPEAAILPGNLYLTVGLYRFVLFSPLLSRV